MNHLECVFAVTSLTFYGFVDTTSIYIHIGLVLTYGTTKERVFQIGDDVRGSNDHTTYGDELIDIFGIQITHLGRDVKIARSYHDTTRCLLILVLLIVLLFLLLVVLSQNRVSRHDVRVVDLIYNHIHQGNHLLRIHLDMSREITRSGERSQVLHVNIKISTSRATKLGELSKIVSVRIGRIRILEIDQKVLESFPTLVHIHVCTPNHSVSTRSPTTG